MIGVYRKCSIGAYWFRIFNSAVMSLKKPLFLSSFVRCALGLLSMLLWLCQLMLSISDKHESLHVVNCGLCWNWYKMFILCCCFSLAAYL